MLRNSSFGISVMSYPLIFEETINNFCDSGVVFTLQLFTCNSNQFLFHSELLTLS